MEGWKKVWSKRLGSYVGFVSAAALVGFLILLVYLSFHDDTGAGIYSQLKLATKVSFSYVGLLWVSLSYIVYRIYHYYRCIYLSQGSYSFARKFSSFTLLPLALAIGLMDVFQPMALIEAPDFGWSNIPSDRPGAAGDRIEKGSKIRGVHYFSRFHEGDRDFSILVENNVKQVVLVPYAYQESFDDPDLRFNRRGRRSNFDRDSLYLSVAQQAEACGLSVLIKPHIWMRTDQGKWRSDIDYEDPADFKTWSTNYTNFILHYARLSEEMKSSHFCIGTELSEITRNHPDYWEGLIREVRKVYGGKIFYAANWYQEYEHISFWHQLDYVGIQAYFPICKKDHPTVEDLLAGWKPYVNKLKKFSSKVQRPILFSELGYKSTHDAAADPWEWITEANRVSKKLSAQTQANCYEAFFRSFWNQPWFAGTLIWQWQAHYDQDKLSTVNSVDFTPQHKPAQIVMAKWFAQ